MSAGEIQNIYCLVQLVNVIAGTGISESITRNVSFEPKSDDFTPYCERRDTKYEKEYSLNDAAMHMYPLVVNAGATVIGT